MSHRRVTDRPRWSALGVACSGRPSTRLVVSCFLDVPCGYAFVGSPCHRRRWRRHVPPPRHRPTTGPAITNECPSRERAQTSAAAHSFTIRRPSVTIFPVHPAGGIPSVGARKPHLTPGLPPVDSRGMGVWLLSDPSILPGRNHPAVQPPETAHVRAACLPRPS